MKYSDVVDIPAPLEEVKQVRDSGSEDVARLDVETYVISDRMATQLTEVVLSNPPPTRMRVPIATAKAAARGRGMAGALCHVPVREERR